MFELVAGLDGDAGLPDSAATGDRDQPAVGQPGSADDAADVLVAADQAGTRHRERAGKGLGSVGFRGRIHGVHAGCGLPLT